MEHYTHAGWPNQVLSPLKSTWTTKGIRPPTPKSTQTASDPRKSNSVMPRSSSIHSRSNLGLNKNRGTGVLVGFASIQAKKVAQETHPVHKPENMARPPHPSESRGLHKSAEEAHLAGLTREKS